MARHQNKAGWVLLRINPELYLAVLIAEYCNPDVTVDDDGFVLFPGEY